MKELKGHLPKQQKVEKLPMITIATPCDEEVPYEFFKQIQELMAQPSDKFEMAFGTVSGTNVFAARKKLVEDMMGEYLLFIDSDMIFNRAMIERLLEADADIIGGVCVQKTPPHYPTIKMKNEEGFYKPVEEVPVNQIIEVDGMGLAFCLIKKKVFSMTKQPWFTPIPRKDDAVAEDLAFCERAKEAGFKILVDTAVQPGHLGKQVFSLETYNTYKEAYEQYKSAKEAKLQTGSPEVR